MTGLTESLHAAAGNDPVDLEPDLDAVHARVDRRRRRRTRARAAGCVVGAVVLLGGIGLAAGAGTGDEPDVLAGDLGVEDETTTSTEASTSEVAPTESTETTTSTEPATTTSTAPTTTTEPPPTTGPPPSTAPAAPTIPDLTWTYDGTEQYRLFQPQCPEITHWVDAAATASDGTAWTMREDYCGESHGDRWEGEGTFSLAGAAGTISGRMTSSAPQPTTGVPYSWTVEEGTGAYAGVTGECVVTIAMTDQVFGSQHHEGAITCALSLDGDGGDGVTEDEVPEAV